MSRDKQTEIMELARELCGEGEYYQDCFHCPTLRCCGVQKLARELCAKGYRKSSELAREIFEEIENKVKASVTIHLEEINKEHIKDTPLYDRHSGIVFALTGMGDFIAELKKKYTESEKDNGN